MGPDNSSAIMPGFVSDRTDRIRVSLNKDGFMPYTTGSRLMPKACALLTSLQENTRSAYSVKSGFAPLRGNEGDLELLFARSLGLKFLLPLHLQGGQVRLKLILKSDPQPPDQVGYVYGQVPGQLATCVKVLVIPVGRRYEQGAGLPVYTYSLLVI